MSAFSLFSFEQDANLCTNTVESTADVRVTLWLTVLLDRDRPKVNASNLGTWQHDPRIIRLRRSHPSKANVFEYI